MSARDRAIKKQLREEQAIQAMRFGAMEEQERIIKLLTTKKEIMIAENANPREIWGIGTAIALILIKGENK